MTQDVVKFLLVDDLPDNLVALQALLAEPGLELLLAHSGREALELLLTHDVALALIDVHMPEIDGFELAELMRGRERTRRVPIIFVTASDHEARREFVGYEAGAVDFLFKPVDPHVLRSKVAVFVELHRQRRELERRVAELTKVREELQSTLDLNELFVAAVGHDLRTPLAAVLAASEVLRLTATEGPAKRAADTVRNSGRSMERLIGDLFDLSRVRLSGGLPIERTDDVDLGAIAFQVINEAKASSAGVTFELESAGDLHGCWDAGRLRQVLTNLTSNAVRHGNGDEPIRLRLNGTGAEEVVVDVANGGAIAAKALPHIFDPFRSFSEGGKKGLGLGLYIVQQVVQAHGGVVTAKTTPTSTQFCVRLPRR
ncbi:MAG: response regulator [Myxococcota bacterium]